MTNEKLVLLSNPPSVAFLALLRFATRAAHELKMHRWQVMLAICITVYGWQISEICKLIRITEGSVVQFRLMVDLAAQQLEDRSHWWQNNATPQSAIRKKSWSFGLIFVRSYSIALQERKKRGVLSSPFAMLVMVVQFFLHALPVPRHFPFIINAVSSLLHFYYWVIYQLCYVNIVTAFISSPKPCWFQSSQALHARSLGFLETYKLRFYATTVLKYARHCKGSPSVHYSNSFHGSFNLLGGRQNWQEYMLF